MKEFGPSGLCVTGAPLDANDQAYMKQNLVLFSDVGHHPKDNKHGIVFTEVSPLVKEILNYYNVNESLCNSKTSKAVVTVVQAS